MQLLPNCFARIPIRIKIFKVTLLVFLSFSFLMFLMLLNGSGFLLNFRVATDNVSCHYFEEGDALLSTDNVGFSPPSNSIFFHETSCKGGLNSRQACGVESAARAHPTWQINVLFSGPVNIEKLEKGSLVKLQEYENVRFARVHTRNYAKGTPLEILLANNPFGDSKWPIEHSADVLRAISLYKYGGIYMDTDVLVVKSLVPLGNNWAGTEDKKLVSNGLIALSNDAVGRKLAETYLIELNSTYNPEYWTHNGPGAITRTLEKVCNAKGLTDWTSLQCEGFHVYSAEYVYPVYYKNNNDYFEVGKVVDGIEKAYTHHMWNKLTKDKKIEKGSLYDKLAKVFCPKIYKMYGDRFGS